MQAKNIYLILSIRLILHIWNTVCPKKSALFKIKHFPLISNKLILLISSRQTPCRFPDRQELFPGLAEILPISFIVKPNISHINYVLKQIRIKLSCHIFNFQQKFVNYDFSWPYKTNVYIIYKTFVIQDANGSGKV